MNEVMISILAGIVRNATPLIILALGETIIERAGVVNLSINGSLLLAAMAGFVSALLTNSVLIGILVAIFVGATCAVIIAFASISLRQDQIAVGFILTLLCADLAQYLGVDYTRVSGPQIDNFSIPFLSEIPVLGIIFFSHDWTVYTSYILAFASWFWLFRTRAGLSHRAIGQQPDVAFARGARVNVQRYMYALVGGGFVGLAGVSYSLRLKPGWSNPATMDGDGWIALSIVVFSGWHPLRIVLASYLYAALRSISLSFQGGNFGFLTALVNALPWLVMILTMILANLMSIDRLISRLPQPVRQWALELFRSDPPKALGERFDKQ